MHRRVSTRVDEAREIIRTSERKAFAWGFLPVPWVDAAAVTVVQLGMIRKLAKIYGVRYREREVRPLLAALGGSLLSAQLGTTVARSVVKSVPGLGPLLGGPIDAQGDMATIRDDCWLVDSG